MKNLVFALSSVLLLGLSVQAKADQLIPVLKVSKTETCGCCAKWVEHAKNAGYRVEVRNMSQPALSALKDKLGIPMRARSCHTVEADGYFIEGHVPLEDLQRLLTENPIASGISVPGMPIGSPGMEMGWQKQPFNTYLLSADQPPSVYAKHNQ